MKKAILHGIGMIKRFEETEVLHGIDIDIYAGDFTVIMGGFWFGEIYTAVCLERYGPFVGRKHFLQGEGDHKGL